MKKLCHDYNFCDAEMPDGKNKILKYTKNLKPIRVPFTAKNHPQQK